MSFANALGEMLHRRRQARELSLERLAKLTGVKEANLIAAEQGELPPTDTAVLRMVTVLIGWRASEFRLSVANLPLPMLQCLAAEGRETTALLHLATNLGVEDLSLLAVLQLSLIAEERREDRIRRNLSRTFTCPLSDELLDEPDELNAKRAGK